MEHAGPEVGPGAEPERAVPPQPAAPAGKAPVDAAPPGKAPVDGAAPGKAPVDGAATDKASVDAAPADAPPGPPGGRGAAPPAAPGSAVATASLSAEVGGAAAVHTMFPDLGAQSGDGDDLALLLDVPLLLTVELGRTRCLVRDVLVLQPGAVLALDRLAGAPVDVLVNGRRIARGEVVVVDENFGVRVTEVPAVDEGRAR